MGVETLTVSLTVITCGTCGCIFGINKTHNDDLIKNNGSFHCPNGHPRRYVGETEEEKLRKQLASERAAHDQTQSALEHKEKEMVKLKKRVTNGVCPCCKRSFKNLARHMKTKHPKEVV